MNIKPIRNEEDLRDAFARLELVFQAQEGSLEADEMEILVTLIEAYENKHYPISAADPIEAIKFRMEQQGLVAKDLEPFIGSSGRVSEVLNRKRRLTLKMIKRLHEGLHIPYDSLLSAA
jgi:HTH-type transcriptional regulator/antitoxin HigA